MTRIISLALFACMLAAADPPAASLLPKETTATLARYEAAVQAAADKARKELTTQSELAGKQGKLDMAIAIRAEIDKLPKAAADFNMASVAGRYAASTDLWKGVFTLTAKGEASTNEGVRGSFTLQGKKITIKWNTGASESFTMSTETEGEGSNKDGIALRVKKMEDK